MHLTVMPTTLSKRMFLSNTCTSSIAHIHAFKSAHLLGHSLIKVMASGDFKLTLLTRTSHLLDHSAAAVPAHPRASVGSSGGGCGNPHYDRH